MEATETTEALRRAVEGMTLDEATAQQLAPGLDTREKLTTALPAMRDLAAGLHERAGRTDERMKEFEKSKKQWTAYAAIIEGMIRDSMRALNIRKLEADDARAALTSREVLRTDDALLLEGLEDTPAFTAMRDSLPPWVTVRLTVDKTRLKGYLQGHPEFLDENPDKAMTDLSWTVRLT